MKLLNELSDLVKSGVISQETAERISDYYQTEKKQSSNRLFIVFGVLGAVLVGLGIILIMAHNWDQLSRGTKTFFAFLPLLTGQILCGTVLIKKQDSVAWRESTSAFLFFATGACIALVSQIYNIPGNLSPFLLTWMILCLPLIYLMKSSITSLLYISGITYFACESGYWSVSFSNPHLYWLMIAAAVPWYYHLFKKNPESNFTKFHHWIFPLSIIISLGTLAGEAGELIFIGYFSFFGFIYMAGTHQNYAQQNSGIRAFNILGALGTLTLLIILSFNWFWNDLRNQEYIWSELLKAPELYATIVLTFLATGFLYVLQKTKSIRDIKPLSVIFLIFIPVFIVGAFSSLAILLINLCIFVIGILTIREGSAQNSLGTLNFGMIIITALIISRFLDTNISFVIRGLIFVGVGTSFIAANYWMLKKRGKNANE
jgi:uncharacterized membrane protein